MNLFFFQFKSQIITVFNSNFTRNNTNFDSVILQKPLIENLKKLGQNQMKFLKNIEKESEKISNDESLRKEFLREAFKLDERLEIDGNIANIGHTFDDEAQVLETVLYDTLTKKKKD